MTDYFAPMGLLEIEGSGQKSATLMSDVYLRLRRDVLDGVLSPGSRLRFEDLRAKYGVGLSPLREALTRLASEKLVQLEQHKGFRVAPISKADLLDVAFMRKEIEVLGVRMSIDKGNDQWESKIVATIHELGKRANIAPDGRVDPEWEKRHKAFHVCLVAACGSPWLLQIHNLLLDHADRYRRLVQYFPLDGRDIHAEHAEIADAVVSRNSEAACYLVKRHLDRTVQALMASGLVIEDDVNETDV